MSDLARQLIREAKEKKLKRLDLGNCGLTSETIPEDLFELTDLEELILSNRYWDWEKGTWIDSVNTAPPNKLSFLPTAIARLQKLQKLVIAGSYEDKWAIKSLKEIASLTNLRELYCSTNQLTDLTPLSGLTNLSVLSCANNQLTDLAPLRNLANLSVLHCFTNQLIELTPISGLTNLSVLDCAYNQLTELPSLRRLTKLTHLYCSNNQLTDLTPLSGLTNLSVLDCDNNPIVNPPEEIVRQGIADIRSYLLAIQQSKKTVSNNEFKIIVLGNSTAGKSSLIEWLQTGQISTNRNSTHGMVVETWEPNFPIGELPDATARILDFGGQEFYHDTHQLFFTRNAIYLVVWEQRHNQHEFIQTAIQLNGQPTEVLLEHFPINYWLGCIRHFIRGYQASANIRQEAPTLLIQNKIDLENNGIQWLDEAALTKNYPFVFDFCAVSLLKKQRTAILREIIQELCNQAPLIRNELPDYWLTIRDKLAKKRKNTLTYREFGELCQSVQSRIDTDEVRTLCLFLRNTFYLQTFFADEANPQPDELLVLKPAWLTERIYKVLNSSLAAKGGQFDKAHIQQALSKKTFDAECKWLRQLLLDYHLIFKKADAPDHYIAPQYLPDMPGRELAFFTKGYTPFFRFAYEGFLHRQIMLQLFARSANQLLPDYFIWKYGMVLAQDNDRLLVRFNRKQNIIELLTEPATSPDTAFAQQVVRDIRELNKPYQAKEYITIRDGVFVPFVDVDRAFDEGWSEFLWDNNRYRTADFDKFLPYATKPVTQRQFYHTRLFISYSKADKSMRDELVTHLSSLKRKGWVSTWHDGMLEPGKEWDPEIKSQLAQADLILLLVSASFINTDYIWEIELQEARRRNIPVVPIIVRSCTWDLLQIKGMTTLPDLLALPEKGKPVESSEWYDRDTAWTRVVNRLAEAIPRLKTNQPTK